MTAPRYQGRELMVVVKISGRREFVRAYWWRHWSMPEGCWWSPDHGIVDPAEWVAE